MVDHSTKQTNAERLFNKWKKLTPKERNDLLQAKFGAAIEEKNLTGLDGEHLLNIFEALIKSFNVSIKFQEQTPDRDDLFDDDDAKDIRTVRDDNTQRLE